MGKPRLTAVEDFCKLISAEDNEELSRMLERPSANLSDVYRWLSELGYKGSLRSIYTYASQQRKIGAEAAKVNKLLSDYDGLASEALLQKMAAIFTQQLDTAIVQLATSEQPVEAADWLKIIPHLGREARSCVTAINQIQTVRDRKALEMAGAFRMAQELRLIFTDSPFESALDEGIKSAFQRIEGDS